VETAARVWQASPQHAGMAIDRLMAQRLVDGTAIVEWAFASDGVLLLTDELASGLAWEALHGAVTKTLARSQVCFESMSVFLSVCLSVRHPSGCLSASLPARRTSTETSICGLQEGLD
jgi:MIF4G like